VPLSLRVDANRWREHLKTYTAAHSGIVPVTKGNGYGFGTPVLAAEAAALGIDTIAVGTYDEVTQATGSFSGEILVLSPWSNSEAGADTGDAKVIHTVSRLDDLAAIAEGPRADVVVEVMTSMRRHGIAVSELEKARDLIAGTKLRGWALHLPLAGNRLAEARDIVAAISAVDQSDVPVWASHLEPADAQQLAADTSRQVRLRVGTALWLGDRPALQARATVLDVHRLARGDRFGYRQRRARRDGWLLVVAGGTAHGIALEAPTPATSMRQRAVSIAKGGLEATGRALSPFRVAGKQRWFAEPPHMQCSLIWLPADVEQPSIGDELDVDVRFTTTQFDRIDWT
jgi:alanine racemase